MKITEYTINSPKIKGHLTVACVSDLHARPADKIIAALKAFAPDLILLAGDILEVANEYMEKRNLNSFKFLEEATKIAPVYYCFGNHEIYYSHASKEAHRLPNKTLEEKYVNRIKSIGINIVNDSSVQIYTPDHNKLYVGGLVCGRDKDPRMHITNPDMDFISRYDGIDGFKMLICHYPHYYEKYLKNTNFDLIVAGHAHGGHWRIFNRGVYAPHQGLFPKYTSGIYDGRFIISTGAVNNSKPIPRFFNPTEILKITVYNSEEMQ